MGLLVVWSGGSVGWGCPVGLGVTSNEVILDEKRVQP